MKSLSRTGAVVVALFAGAVFGSMSTGCFALWLGVARADGSPGTTMTVPCSETAMYNGNTSFAVASFPGVSANDIQATVWLVPPSAPAVTIGGVVFSNPTMAPLPTLGGQALVADGSAAVACAKGASVTLYVRQ